MSNQSDNNQNEKEKTHISAAGKFFDIALTVFIYLLSACILVSAVLFSFDTSSDKSLFGFRYYTVQTGSMAPTYSVGDVIFVKLKAPEDIYKDDIITFNPSADSEAYLTHRVVERIDNYEGSGVICFRTKGDANNIEDSFLIDGGRVIGTVEFGVPFLGYAIRFIQLRWYLVLLIVGSTGVFLYLMKKYFQSDEDEDNETVETTAEDTEKDNTEKV